MPYRPIAGTTAHYALVSVDRNGTESIQEQDAGGVPTSTRVLEALSADDVTDVFVWIHGWKGDVGEAIAQYDRWIGAFVAQGNDRARMLTQRPGFKELHLGFHWPSLSWGDESAPVSGDSFAPGTGLPLDERVDAQAKELGDSPAVRVALRALFEEARTHAAAQALTDKAREAYRMLDEALALGESGVPGDGASDRAPFDPDQAVETVDSLDNADFAGSGGLAGILLSPLRQLSFWTMKKRAKTVGEVGLHPLLMRMQDIAPALRIHLMGHSFGCIVVSAGVAGATGAQVLPRAIDSCVLVQGAMSLWSFAMSAPFNGGTAGYFSKVVSNRSVRGPIVTTRSGYDYAVGRIYPWAAGVAGQVDFKLPEFGAIGAFGICGVPAAEAQAMKPASDPYVFVDGGIYNVDGSAYICKIDGVAGAHSDIGGPEVAHLIWQAAMPAPEAA